MSEWREKTNQIRKFFTGFLTGLSDTAPSGESEVLVSSRDELNGIILWELV